MQFKLPELGEGVHEGELIKWRVKPGDQVNYDQPLCEIMTDKATVEIPSAFKGKVQEIHAKEGSVVTVGQLMISFEGVGGAAQASAPAASHAAPAPAAPAAVQAKAPEPTRAVVPSAAASSAPVAAPAMETHVGNRVPAAPSTRRFAREQGVDLAQISPSGPNGRVMKEDIEKWLSGAGAVSAGPASVAKGAARTFPQGGEERIPMRGLRKKISEKMHLSKSTAAHFTYVEEADATELVKLRAMAKDIGAKQGIKVTYLPFIMKAMVACLRNFPIMNSSYDEERGEIVIKHYYNIGLSIQTNDGLTAPVVKNVEHKSILELARDIQDIVDRARANKLTNEDFKGGSITLTNAGSIGGVLATPIINYPEVAILGFNKIARKPVVINRDGKEEIAIRDWTYFSISLDHRIVDGAIAAEFMNQFIKYIENPSLLLLSSI
ncbi:MAG: dihydrolipoamide acetyltransferase family protein [Bdellovibrionia bacterium]